MTIYGKEHYNLLKPNIIASFDEKCVISLALGKVEPVDKKKSLITTSSWREGYKVASDLLKQQQKEKKEPIMRKETVQQPIRSDSPPTKDTASTGLKL